MKKFDVCLMNPPYGDNTPLYAKFFEKALEVADVVGTIMPVDMETNAARTKSHADRVKRHALTEPENVSSYFPTVGLRDKIHFIWASGSQKNPVPEYVDPLESIPLLYPERDRLRFLRGGIGHYVGHEDPKGKEVLWSLQKDGIIKKKITKELYHQCFNKEQRHNTAPWRVLINNMPSKGRFNCEIVNCDTPISIKILAVPCGTKKEAMKIKEWLTSDTIRDTILDMLNAKNIYTVSRKIVERLPTYE